MLSYFQDNDYRGYRLSISFNHAYEDLDARCNKISNLEERRGKNPFKFYISKAAILLSILLHSAPFPKVRRNERRYRLRSQPRLREGEERRGLRPWGEILPRGIYGYHGGLRLTVLEAR